MSVSHATKTWWWPHFCDPEMWYFLARGNMLWRVKSTLTMAIALSKLSQSCAFAFAFAEMSVLHCSSCFKATSPCCHRASPFYVISRAKYHFSPCPYSCFLWCFILPRPYIAKLSFKILRNVAVATVAVRCTHVLWRRLNAVNLFLQNSRHSKMHFIHI